MLLDELSTAIVDNFMGCRFVSRDFEMDPNLILRLFACLALLLLTEP